MLVKPQHLSHNQLHIQPIQFENRPFVFNTDNTLFDKRAEKTPLHTPGIHEAHIGFQLRTVKDRRDHDGAEYPKGALRERDITELSTLLYTTCKDFKGYQEMVKNILYTTNRIYEPLYVCVLKTTSTLYGALVVHAHTKEVKLCYSIGRSMVKYKVMRSCARYFTEYTENAWDAEVRRFFAKEWPNVNLFRLEPSRFHIVISNDDTKVIDPSSVACSDPSILKWQFGKAIKRGENVLLKIGVHKSDLPNDASVTCIPFDDFYAVDEHVTTTLATSLQNIAASSDPDQHSLVNVTIREFATMK